jgi:hypothetical protein
MVLALSKTMAEPGGASVVYRCPGTPTVYEDALTATQARARGCHAVFGMGRTHADIANRPSTAPTSLRRPPTHDKARLVDTSTQRARDADARFILDLELKREQGRRSDLLAELSQLNAAATASASSGAQQQRKSAELRQAITRVEADVDAIQREIARHSTSQRSLIRIAVER